jgi:hypothetical protein
MRHMTNRALLTASTVLGSEHFIGLHHLLASLSRIYTSLHKALSFCVSKKITRS